MFIKLRRYFISASHFALWPLHLHDSISNSIALMMKSNCQDEESHQDSDTLKDEDIPPPSGPEEEW